MASPDEVYHELGADYFTSRDNPERRRDRLVAQLTKLGYDVELTPAEAA
jgi:transposase